MAEEVAVEQTQSFMDAVRARGVPERRVALMAARLRRRIPRDDEYITRALGFAGVQLAHLLELEAECEHGTMDLAVEHGTSMFLRQGTVRSWFMSPMDEARAARASPYLQFEPIGRLRCSCGEKIRYHNYAGGFCAGACTFLPWHYQGNGGPCAFCHNYGFDTLPDPVPAAASSSEASSVEDDASSSASEAEASEAETEASESESLSESDTSDAGTSGSESEAEDAAEDRCTDMVGPKRRRSQRLAGGAPSTKRRRRGYAADSGYEADSDTEEVDGAPA